ncbi:hypothetical protein MMC30_003372 [Trapelia coarctata]|nr:hypothetical protein [Trapelia coarctata]
MSTTKIPSLGQTNMPNITQLGTRVHMCEFCGKRTHWVHCQWCWEQTLWCLRPLSLDPEILGYAAANLEHMGDMLDEAIANAKQEVTASDHAIPVMHFTIRNLERVAVTVQRATRNFRGAVAVGSIALHHLEGDGL